MIARWARLPLNVWLEPLLAFIIFGCVAYSMYFLLTEGFLPHPFFYEPSDPWMDWFNTAFFAHEGTAYEEWGSIYPPLSFVFVGALGNSACYANSYGPTSRSCDWIGGVALHVIYLINVWLTARAFLKTDRKTALPRAFALTAGLPMLYALERGNLVLVCYTCILLAYGPLVRSARLRWIAAGLAINFKVYLVAALAPQLLRRRWRWFEGGMIATIVIYLISYMLYGSGTPLEIYQNLAGLSEDYAAGGFFDAWYATSYTPFLSLLGAPFFPINSIIGSWATDTLLILLPTLLSIVQATILLACFAAWLRPEVIPMYRLTALGIGMALITAEAGGYSQSLLLLFVFMERWRGAGAKWAIFTTYILCLPADIIIDRLNVMAMRYSFLMGDQLVTFNYVLTLGPFIRPLLIMSIPFALSCATIRAVWIDIQQQGWKGRWRFRRDMPIMVGTGTATPPPTSIAPAE